MSPLFVAFYYFVLDIVLKHFLPLIVNQGGRGLPQAVLYFPGLVNESSAIDNFA